MLEKTLEGPMDSKEIQPVNPKGNQPWVFNGQTDALIFFTEKYLDTGKDWELEWKGTTEDEMVGWHHWLNVHESEQSPGDSEKQESLACCSLLGCKELDMT